MSKEITQNQVLELFHYDRGSLYWKIKPNQSTYNGQKAGSKYNNDRIYIKCQYGRFLAHRLIFLYHKGYLPKYIDHIDGDGLNNNIENLRGCTLKQNQWNRKSNKNNTSGVKGVYFCNTHKRFIVGIRVGGKVIHNGTYTDIDKAKVAVEELRSRLHKEFANNGGMN